MFINGKRGRAKPTSYCEHFDTFTYTDIFSLGPPCLNK